MAFDYKKEYKGLYLPPKKPALVEVPAMRFAAVQGKGDPNVEGGAYQEALGLLYGVAFTVKMSKLGNRAIEGYFDYVVPPLEEMCIRDRLFWYAVVHVPLYVQRGLWRLYQRDEHVRGAFYYSGCRQAGAGRGYQPARGKAAEAGP